MKLSEAKKNVIYKIEEIDYTGNDVFRSKASQLGILHGQTIKLKHYAPIFKDPLLFEIDNSLIALTKAEANYITASELGDNNEF